MKINIRSVIQTSVLGFILFSLLVANYVSPVHAQLSEEQILLYKKGVNYYDIGFSTQCSGAYGSIAGDLGFNGDVEGIYSSGLTGPYIVEMFMIHILKRMAQISGKPESDFLTKEHVIALIAFQKGEGGDTNNSSVFNPMNGGMDPEVVLGVSYDGIWAGDGIDGRRAYPTFDIGVELYARQFLKGYQSRLGYVLSKPDSTAENFAHALTFFEEYAGNKLWASASLDSESSSKRQLGFIADVRRDYGAWAGLMMGTEVEELDEGLYRKDLIYYKDLVRGDIQEGDVSAPPSSFTCNTAGTGGVLSNEFIFYSQNAEPWGSQTYPGGSTFDKSGCGPTSYSMIAATLLQDRSITPLSFRDKLVEAGYSIDGYRGLDSAKAGKEFYGLNYRQITTKDQIRTALQSGSLVISGGGGDGTPYRFEAHIVVLRSIDSNDIVTVADPEDNKMTDRTYPLDAFLDSGKYFAAVYK